MTRKIILIILLIAGMLASCAAIAAIVVLAFSPFGGSLFNSFPIPDAASNYSVENTDEQSFAVDGPVTLNLTSIAGDVRVFADPAIDNQVQVTAHRTAWGANLEQAQAAIEKLLVIMNQENNAITIQVEEQRTALPVNNRTSTVAFTIRVPVQTSVSLETSFGAIELTGTHGSAVLDSKFGAITISDIQGGLKAATTNGSVTARRVQSPDSSSISLSSDFGAVILSDSSADEVTVTSRNGDVDLTNVAASGAVKLESQFGAIRFNDGSGASLEVETSNGAVTLKNLSIANRVQANSQFGAISLSAVTGGSYDLKTSNGAVSVDSAQGPVKARSDFGDIEVMGENVTLDLVTRSGKIIFRGSLGDGPHTLRTEFGEVRITLPGDSAFDFDLKTEFGAIRSEFEVQISGAPNEKHWIGSINDGGDLLTAETKNGDITLEQSR